MTQVKRTRIEKLKTCTDAFMFGTSILRKEFEKKPSQLGVSLVVNAAFAAELAMKLYIEATTKKKNIGHDLKLLWYKLPIDVKKHLVPLICKRANINVDKFDILMEKCSNTFKDWRYFYEKGYSEEKPLETNYIFLISLAHEIRHLSDSFIKASK